VKNPAQRTLLASLIASGLGMSLVTSPAAAQGEGQPPASQPAPAAETPPAPPSSAASEPAPAPAPAAAPAPAPAPAASGDNVQKVVVTGSNVPTTRDAVAVSVIEVNQEMIENSGASPNMLDLLRKVVPEFQGRGNTGSTNANNTNQNTAGGAQLQLKNLDTLVLVNGRRLAISAIAGIGGKAFVDANEIPASAIERVEIISDGSSAIYGSDAIGGVVNVILKSNYKGFDAGVRLGHANDYNERSAYFTGGTFKDGFSVSVSGSFVHTDPLYQKDRAFSSNITGRNPTVPGTIGGANPAVLAPNFNSPSQNTPTGINATATSIADLIANGTYLPSTIAANAAMYNFSDFQTLTLRQDQAALSLNASDQLDGKRLVVFGDLQLSQNLSFTQFLPISTTLTVPNGAPFNPLAADFANVNFSYWPLPKQFHNDQKALRVVAGLRGALDDGWNWETALVHSRNELEQQQWNVIFKPNLALAIAGGYDANGNPVAGGAYSKVYNGFSTSNAQVLTPALDPFARSDGVNPAALANLYGAEFIHATSQLDSIDGSLSGTFLNLPAGRVGFATGLAARKESLDAHADENGRNTGPTAQQWLGGTFADPFSKSRDVKSAYLELRVPLASEKANAWGFHAFDLIGAGREEDYSDVGSAFVPKVGFRWQPASSEFTVRGSFSKSFTAPTLYAQYGPTDTRIVGPAVIQSVFGLPNAGLQGEDGNNPDLQPSTAHTRSLNLSWQPAAVPGLSASVEYNSVDQKGFPGGIGFTNILQSVDQEGSASPFSGNVAKNAFPGQPGAVPFSTPGELSAYLAEDPNNSLNVYAIDRFMNLGGLKVRVWNLNGEYFWETANTGTFTVGTQGTFFQKYQFQALPTQKFYEYAGYATNGGTGVQGTLPKWRFYTTLNWQGEEWGATLGNTFVSSVTDIGPGGIVFENSKTLKATPVSSYFSFDARLAYKGAPIPGMGLKGWDAAFGINNLTNQMPPAAPQAFTDNNADVATYSPIGRLFYVTLAAKF
jgi:iron complex outermembrane receptor protein